MNRREFFGLLAALVAVRLKPTSISAEPARRLYLYYRPGGPPRSSRDIVGSWTPLTPDEARALFAEDR